MSATEREKEKPIQEPIEEKTEESVQEAIQESTQEPKEDVTEEPIQEQTEEVTEEVTEEPTQEQIGDSVDEAIDDTTEESAEKSIEKRKKIVIGTIISLCILLIIYFGMTRYFMNHFYFGSEINSISVSGMSVEDAKITTKAKLKDYKLNLKERGGKSEQIKANDIGLKYSLDEEFKKLKDRQNSFKWIIAFFTDEDCKMRVGISFDEKLLKKQIDKLSCFKSSNIIEPKNPSFKYVDNNYQIVDEVPGNKVDKGILYSRVAGSILNGEAEIDLESVGCYIKPKYNSKSTKIIKIRDILNKYASSKISYIFGNRKETLDGTIINKWLIVDKNFKVTFDEEKIKNYIDVLSKTYNTIGKTRKFVTSSGKTINIGGGDYGWSIDKAKETQNLIKDIKQGKTITKEPVYSQTAFSHADNDIGNTYVEIDLAKQYLWFYKNGSLIAQGAVVTGNVRRNHSTPTGIYRLKYKQRGAILKGPGYASYVTFWMPFNGGIGIHDASWRSVFGGSIYWTNGSHGCVNSPYNLAKAIFNNIEEGTPVICY